MYIETERLIIKNLDIKNTDELYLILSNEDVMRYIETPFSYKQTEVFIINSALCNPPLIFGVFSKGTNKLIGHLIFHPLNDNNYEIGWVLSKPYWNKGFAQELTKYIINYAKQKGINGLVIECDKKQLTTKHIAEKFGFQQEKDCNESALIKYELKLH